MLRRNSNSRVTRRRSTAKLPESSGKLAAEAYRKLVSLVMETSRRTQDCLKELITLQKGLMQGVQDFLALDQALVDEPALALVQDCHAFFEAIDITLAEHLGFRQVADSGKDILAELDKLLNLLSKWADAVSEQEHYREKLTSLEKQGNADKIARNREKLDHAKITVMGYQQSGDVELGHFGEMRTVQVRASLIAHLRTYVQVLADIGWQASPLASRFAAELAAGTSVQIVALRRARDLNGLIASIEGPDLKDPGRLLVRLPDGEQKSVRREHLQPVTNRSPTRAGSTDGDSPDSRLANALPDSSSGMSPSRAEEITPAAAEPSPEAKVSEPAPDGTEAGSGEAQSSGRGKVAAKFLGRRPKEPKEPENLAPEELPEAEPEADSPMVGFGFCGRSIKLWKAPAAPELGVKAAADSGWLPTIAERITGLLHGVALTSDPLFPRLTAGVRRYYFEFSVLEAIDKGTARTLALGFAWPPSPEMEGPDSWDDEGRPMRNSSRADVADGDQTAKAKAVRSLPESSTQLPYAFVVGGDLPRASLGARDLGKVSGWRPLKDAKSGCSLGCLLEQDEEGPRREGSEETSPKWRLSVLMNGTRCCCVEVEPPSWGAGPPHGVIDVCGSVRRVRLRQTLEPPAEFQDAPNVGRLLSQTSTAGPAPVAESLRRIVSAPAN